MAEIAKQSLQRFYQFDEHKSIDEIAMRNHLFKEVNVYERLKEKNKNSQKKFKHVDGPPFANSGNPHMGHLTVGIAKSVMYIVKSMQGYDFDITIGYDTHGHPIEIATNKPKTSPEATIIV